MVHVWLQRSQSLWQVKRAVEALNSIWEKRGDAEQSWPCLTLRSRSGVEKVCEGRDNEIKLSCEQMTLSENWNNLLWLTVPCVFTRGHPYSSTTGTWPAWHWTYTILVQPWVLATRSHLLRTASVATGCGRLCLVKGTTSKWCSCV